MDRPKEKDYYGILGVSRDASPATIKRAYRKLAKALRLGVAATTELEVDDLEVAYETLVDADRRRRYDESLGRAEARPMASRPTARQRADDGLRRPGPIQTLGGGEVFLSPSEARRGRSLPLSLPLSARCEDCRGTGGALLDCYTCEGAGVVMRRRPLQVLIPPGVRDGAVLHIATGQPAQPAFLLTVHVLRS